MKYCTKLVFTKLLLELFAWEFCKITSKVFAYVGTERGILCDLTLRLSSHLFSAVTYARKRKRPYGDLYKMIILDECSNTR